jgi:hypothetical protein
MNAGWVRGEYLGLQIPAHAGALRDGGPEFLTEAFRASSALPDGATVRAITEVREFRGGSTGRKALLSVDYDSADLPTDLFVKFSRDLDDPARDRGRTQMEFEVRFALLSRISDFPVAVPRCLFADYHGASGTGLLITDRVAYGESGIEPHYDKCMDYLIPDPLDHYVALLGALGRLAGTHKSGRLPGELVERFPADMESLSVGERVPYSPDQLQRRVGRLADLAEAQPGLLPANICAPQFLSQLERDVPRIAELESAIWRHLAAEPDYIALCHWNANVDNAWFWRDSRDRLQCGLLDWGCVGQMNLAMAVWGAMCGAETEMWNRHLDELLGVLIDEFRSAGGPALDVATLRRFVMLYAAVMGTAWLLDVPSYLLRLLPDQVADRFDTRIAGDEQARSLQLMMTNFLNLWQRNDFGALLDEAVG